jgi:aminoglycoside 3-N-acetyltransferase
MGADAPKRPHGGRGIVIDARDIAAALKSLGVRRTDTLWVHAGLQTALKVAGATAADKVETVLSGLEQAVPDGRLVLPTFTYSFTRGATFDVASSPSTVGILSERFRGRSGVRRTADPIFSAAISGPLPGAWERRLLSVRDTDCFGEDSVFAFLRDVDARLLFLGVGFSYCTFVHHVEQRLAVPYRYFKAFEGTIVADGREQRTTARYFVRDLEADVEPFFEPLAEALVHAGAARRATLPRGPSVLVTSTRAVEAEAVRRVGEQPDFLLARGHRPAAVGA